MATKIIITLAVVSFFLSGFAEAKQHRAHHGLIRDINYSAEITDGYLFQASDCKIVIHGHGGGYETHNCKIIWKEK